MTTNANLPAMSIFGSTAIPATAGGQQCAGLTKKELFCLHHGVAESGDPELDAIIRKGNHQKAAMAAMQGILAQMSLYPKDAAEKAVRHADALLAELER